MRCLVLQHVAFESLGVFAGPLEEAGYTVSYVQAGLAPLDKREWLDAELAVILGGPIGVDQVDVYPFLRLELDLTKARLASGRPLLGVCLGAQLMASARGFTPGAARKSAGARWS